MNLMMRRAIGAYYTPGSASAWMAAWLARDHIRTVLEPSCGDGAFVNAVFDAFDAYGLPVRIVACDKDANALSKISPKPALQLVHEDFHRLEPCAVDGVIGNPPFVRLRHLGHEGMDSAMHAGERALGHTIDPSGSTWMTMVLHAVSFLRPGGRLAFILPSDALYVRYARPFWEFMAQRFGSLRLVRCRERIFPEILQDVVILMADRAGASTERVCHDLYDSLTDMTGGSSPESAYILISDIANGNKPFVRAVLGSALERSLNDIHAKTARADSYVKFNIGYVAGDKHFFHPGLDVCNRYQLPDRSLRAAAKSGRQLGRSGLLASNLAPGAVDRLWLPDRGRLTQGEQQYIQAGEAAGVHLRYKTRIRNPWYVVPGVKVPDVIVPVFGKLPKLMLNDAGLVTSNSMVSGYWRKPVDALRFALTWYSSVTRLGIELSVHALGGGVMVVIPGEADAIRMAPVPDLPVPSMLLSELEEALLAGDLRQAYSVGDTYLMAAGWKQHEIHAAAEMADALLEWRIGR